MPDSGDPRQGDVCAPSWKRLSPQGLDDLQPGYKTPPAGAPAGGMTVRHERVANRRRRVWQGGQPESSERKERVGTKPCGLGVYIVFLLYEGKRGRYLCQQYSTRLCAWGAWIAVTWLTVRSNPANRLMRWPEGSIRAGGALKSPGKKGVAKGREKRYYLLMSDPVRPFCGGDQHAVKSGLNHFAALPRFAPAAAPGIGRVRNPACSHSDAMHSCFWSWSSAFCRSS